MDHHWLLTTPALDQTQVYRCDVCGWITHAPSKQQCPGAPVKQYPWNPWPTGMVTRRQLADKKLIPGPLAGVIAYDKSSDGDGWLRLYRIDEATPRPADEKRQAAQAKAAATRERAKYCVRCDRYIGAGASGRTCNGCHSLRAACQLVASGDFVVWDSETTDLNGRFIEVAAIDAMGRVRFDQRIRPPEPVSQGAYEVHGIGQEELVECPDFRAVYADLRAALHDQVWCIYNAAFDKGILDYEMDISLHRHWYEAHRILPRGQFCAMEHYAAVHGEWRRNDYRWQKLSTACARFGIVVAESAHSALGDCQRTLELIYRMAEEYMKYE